MKHNGFFITLEGVEGAGKTTQIHLLAEALGENVIVTREPGGTQISEQIREIFLTAAEISAQTELMLIAASRAQHVSELILPALKDGKTVICDRFSDATIAYQGYRKGIDLKRIEQVNSIATQGLKPDVTFLLDLLPHVGLNRKRESDEPLTRLELETITSHEKVRKGYLALAKSESERVMIINAQLGIDEVSKILVSETKRRMQMKTQHRY
ncbi:dTMP kinase [Candidatus Poribacteria bacterium]|nr:dTMP kinase [Candidatus Poribacteria bacterium]MYF57196.1 dTMP kinase [Candidatus Poribacteria bacterium]MYI93710.1 dTMP kinase [Candidatus Poribacteria bacterium]